MKEKFNLIQALELMDMGEKVLNTKHNSVFWFENGELQNNDYCSLNIHSQSLLKEKVWEVYEEKPILDVKEKAYLEAVLRPFKDRFVYLTKTFFLNSEYIEIVLKDVTNISEWVSLNLPRFKPNTMYKGMELHKKYTLEELGLLKDEEEK